MKRIFFAISFIFVLFLAACNTLPQEAKTTNNTPTTSTTINQPGITPTTISPNTDDSSSKTTTTSPGISPTTTKVQIVIEEPKDEPVEEGPQLNKNTFDQLLKDFKENFSEDHNNFIFDIEYSLISDSYSKNSDGSVSEDIWAHAWEIFGARFTKCNNYLLAESDTDLRYYSLTENSFEMLNPGKYDAMTSGSTALLDLMINYSYYDVFLNPDYYTLSESGTYFTVNADGIAALSNMAPHPMVPIDDIRVLKPEKITGTYSDGVINLSYSYIERDSTKSEYYVYEYDCDWHLIIGAIDTMDTPEEDEYIISVNNGKADRGFVTPSQTIAKAGTVITLSVETYDKWVISSLKANDVDVEKKDGVYTFTMPAAHVFVEPLYEESENLFTITYDNVGGGGKASGPRVAEAGDTINVTVEPDTGYVLKTISVDDEIITGTTFTMPSHDVTVKVSYGFSATAIYMILFQLKTKMVK